MIHIYKGYLLYMYKILNFAKPIVNLTYTFKPSGRVFIVILRINGIYENGILLC